MWRDYVRTHRGLRKEAQKARELQEQRARTNRAWERTFRDRIRDREQQIDELTRDKEALLLSLSLIRERNAEIWDEAVEATHDWMANNPSPSGTPIDPPSNPYEA